MNNLSAEERKQIAIEEIANNPQETICAMAAVKMAEHAVERNVKVTEIETETFIDGKKRKVTLVATVTEI